MPECGREKRFSYHQLLWYYDWHRRSNYKGKVIINHKYFDLGCAKLERLELCWRSVGNKIQLKLYYFCLEITALSLISLTHSQHSRQASHKNLAICSRKKWPYDITDFYKTPWIPLLMQRHQCSLLPWLSLTTLTTIQYSECSVFHYLEASKCNCNTLSICFRAVRMEDGLSLLFKKDGTLGSTIAPQLLRQWYLLS